MALSALGLLQQGLDRLRGFPDQSSDKTLPQNANATGQAGGQARANGQNSLAGEANSGKSGRRPFKDAVDVPASLLKNRAGDVEKGDKKQTADVAVSPSEAIQKLLGSALDAIVGTLAEVFERLGSTKEAALEFAQGLVNSIKQGASSSDEFSFSFEQAVSINSRKAVSYSGADGTGSGVTERAYLAVQSLDIYVNNKTGEFSFNFASVQAEVTKTTAVAQSSSAAGAASALGNVFQALGNDSLLDAGNGLGLDKAGKGIDEILNQLVGQRKQNTSAEETSPALEGIPLIGLPIEEPLISLREREEIPARGEGEDSFTRFRADLLVSLGQLFNGQDGPVLEDRQGVRHLLREGLADFAPRVGVDA
ncbi:hypothetical protein [Kiloniella laminariae]|uniref:hypothetical protein n=1 Tax=Kiloniella laminariae TaxID=454162 RepID=UPI0003A77446|nr:hypothetical protein [Kiloniella laminariae]